MKAFFNTAFRVACVAGLLLIGCAFFEKTFLWQREKQDRLLRLQDAYDAFNKEQGIVASSEQGNLNARGEVGGLRIVLAKDEEAVVAREDDLILLYGTKPLPLSAHERGERDHWAEHTAQFKRNATRRVAASEPTIHAVPVPAPTPFRFAGTALSTGQLVPVDPGADGPAVVRPRVVICGRVLGRTDRGTLIGCATPTERNAIPGAPKVALAGTSLVQGVVLLIGDPRERAVLEGDVVTYVTAFQEETYQYDAGGRIRTARGYRYTGGH